MRITNFLKAMRSRAVPVASHFCEHGVLTSEICTECVDDFVANFHLIKEGECIPVPVEAETPSEVGKKDDTGKAPLVRGVIQYFPNALNAVAEVSAFGAKKYAWGNWRFVADGLGRYTDALGRHIASEAIEERDQESGLRHAAHAAWNALARLEFLLTQKD